MRLRLAVPLALFIAAAACGSVPDDPGARIFAPAGVISGSVLYQGPRPCSFNGHIVGAAILFVFDRRNPPPPSGLASTPVNFVDVTGDALFPNEPRYTGTDKPYCPLENGFTETITVTAPFAVAPLAGGSYMIQSFYDYTGDFLPTFKFRQLPERGDVGGGDLDTADALKAVNAGNPNYMAHFLEVDVGIPEPLQSGQTIPTYDIPSTGYVANNVNVAIGQPLPYTRPYLWAQGLTTSFQSGSPSTVAQTVVQDSSCPQGQSGSNNCPTGGDGLGSGSLDHTAETDPDYKPILTIPQDLAVLSPPAVTDPDGANMFDAGFPHIKLMFGVPDSEKPCATSSGACSQSAAPGQSNPFHFQLDNSGFQVWQNAAFDATNQLWKPLMIAEGGGVPMLWPLVILTKLIDNPTDPNTGLAIDALHANDPAGLTAQGDATHPVVIMQGITLLDAPQLNPLTGANAQPDTFLNTALGGGAGNLLGSLAPDTIFDRTKGTPTVMQQDHLMVALRPSVICFNHLFDNPLPADTRGVLVSPYSSNTVANQTSTGPIVPPDLLANGPPAVPDADSRFQVTNLVNAVQYGCLPKGRYAINVVYPDGQAWTVPNEAGACSGAEGATDFGALTCTIKPRPVLYSQGNRAVVEIVGPKDPDSCKTSGPGAGNPDQGAAPAIDSTGKPLAAFAVPAACNPTASQ
jgi:hypothetical protein